MIILGMLLEAGQYYIPGRLFSFLDITSNTVGVFLGIILGNYVRKQLGFV
jgi:VanZ family protein